MKNLLIVDDEKLILSSLSEVLGICNNGFNIVTAGNVEEAVRVLGSMNIDIVITDLNMPEKSGYEFIADIFKNYSDIPVIVMTASICDSNCRMLKALNVRNIISKPFQFEKMLEMIHGVLHSGQKNA